MVKIRIYCGKCKRRIPAYFELIKPRKWARYKRLIEKEKWKLFGKRIFIVDGKVLIHRGYTTELEDMRVEDNHVYCDFHCAYCGHIHRNLDILEQLKRGQKGIIF